MNFAAVQKLETDSLTILQRIAKKDRTAIKECLDAYGDLIWTIAKKAAASNEEAENTTQEIFNDIWQYAERYDSKEFTEFIFIMLIANRHLIKSKKAKLLKRRKRTSLTSKGKVKTAGIPNPFRDTVRCQTFEIKPVKINKPVRILYADDDEDACEMMSVLLGLSEIEVTIAKTIAEARQLAQTEKFDLYLLETGFPDGNGFNLCRQLREINSMIPIIFYSGEARLSYKAKGLAAGADAYLVKPHTNIVAPIIFQLLTEVAELY